MTSELKPSELEFLKTVSVLYVEDDDEARELLARFLKRRVGRLDVAVNGKEGLESFKANHQDVVISDIKMPVMDGLEMAEQIKALSEDVPVIVITAYSDIEYMQHAIELGVDRYVTKPVNPDLLLQALVKSAREVFHRRELEKMNKELTETLNQTVFALSRAIELRDPYTAGHQFRVAMLARAIAQKMGLDEFRIQGLFLAGVVHDLGKIKIPSEILVKPSRLTDMEYTLIKAHSQVGHDLLKDIHFPWPIAQMVLQHHERQDGSGYPNGQSGEDILLESRILAVADVAEAMSSDRPYRPALGIGPAMQELEKNRGNLYDPEVVDVCLGLLKEHGEAIWRGELPQWGVLSARVPAQEAPAPLS